MEARCDADRDIRGTHTPNVSHRNSRYYLLTVSVWRRKQVLLEPLIERECILFCQFISKECDRLMN